jgi:hypothetical protein
VIDEIAPGVARVARRNPSGWTVDMVLVSLGDGALVYSPTSHGDRTAEVAAKFGAPRVLVAPNHFHNLALAKYRELFPEAVTVAGDGAHARLEKKGHRVRSLGEATLPTGVRLLSCEGLKTGETWLVVERDGHKTLVVCDAFFNVEEECSGFEGFMLRRLRTVGGLQLGRTFGWLAVADKKTYRKWACDTLEREKPNAIAFSHGAPLRDEAGWKRAVELIERHLG